MDIEERKVDAVTILTPLGDLSAGRDRGSLQQKVKETLDAKARLLVIDCEKVNQMSASGVRTLLQSKKRLSSLGGHIVLCGMSDKVRKAFALSSFDRDFLIVASRKEAVEAAARAAMTPPESSAVADRLAVLAAKALGLKRRIVTTAPEEGPKDEAALSRLRELILAAPSAGETT
jgi:anti-anti-sigma factor